MTTDPDLVAGRVPAPIRDALARRSADRPIVLWEVDHPDGYVRAWSGAGPLSYDGETWFGFGALVGMTFPQFTRKTGVRTATFTLSGVTAQQLQMITAQVRGRYARVSLAVLRAGRRAVNGEIYPLLVGMADSQDYKIDTNQAISIVLAVNQPIEILDRTLNWAWTSNWLKSEYGSNIVGLDDLNNLASGLDSWLPAS